MFSIAKNTCAMQHPEIEPGPCNWPRRLSVINVPLPRYSTTFPRFSSTARMLPWHRYRMLPSLYHAPEQIIPSSSISLTTKWSSRLSTSSMELVAISQINCKHATPTTCNISSVVAQLVDSYNTISKTFTLVLLMIMSVGFGGYQANV